MAAPEVAAMRVLLTGTRSFGATALQAMQAEGHDVAAFWGLKEDKALRAAGRAGVSSWTEMTPEKVADLEVDLVVSAHSHAFVSRKVRQQTRLGGIGYHPSLLPRHRGKDAVRWTVHMGDPVAGGSVYWLTDNVDGGPLAAQDWCHVDPKWDHSDLWRKELFPMGIWLLTKVLRDLDRQQMVEVPQNERVATWEPSWDRPPLYRPDLTQIGSGPAGMESKVTRDALR